MSAERRKMLVLMKKKEIPPRMMQTYRESNGLMQTPMRNRQPTPIPTAADIQIDLKALTNMNLVSRLESLRMFSLI